MKPFLLWSRSRNSQWPRKPSKKVRSFPRFSVFGFPGHSNYGGLETQKDSSRPIPSDPAIFLLWPRKHFGHWENGRSSVSKRTSQIFLFFDFAVHLGQYPLKSSISRTFRCKKECTNTRMIVIFAAENGTKVTLRTRISVLGGDGKCVFVCSLCATEARSNEQKLGSKRSVRALTWIW